MTDELASATLHLQQLKVLIDAEKLLPSEALVLDFQRAIDYLEGSLDQLREKYMDKRIVKQFENDDGELQEYTGRVSAVDWDMTQCCYLFHVQYDADSDEEDMEVWQVKKYIRD